MPGVHVPDEPEATLAGERIDDVALLTPVITARGAGDISSYAISAARFAMCPRSAS